jgi:hypothetical protein
MIAIAVRNPETMAAPRFRLSFAFFGRIWPVRVSEPSLNHRIGGASPEKFGVGPEKANPGQKPTWTSGE